MRGNVCVDVFQQEQLLASYPVYPGDLRAIGHRRDYLAHCIERTKREIAIPTDKAATLTAKFSTRRDEDCRL
jgi:replicative superfamily II helicase